MDPDQTPSRDSGPPELARAATATLSAVTARLPGAEQRPGQLAMAAAVAEAIAAERHLVVQAGTGTGKSLAYLVPAILSGRRVVVATATRTLQDQLAGNDLPFLAEHLDRPFSFAILKGRSNYLCHQRLRELTGEGAQQELAGLVAGRAALERLAAWAARTHSGDRADLDEEPPPSLWSAVSVGPRECPGATRCPSGEICFAERARARAAASDVVVVNLHLYGLHLATGGAVLPHHEVAVIDEAHQLEEVISATAGVELGAGRFSALAHATRAVVADDTLVGDLDRAGARLASVLADHEGRRLRRPDPEVTEVIVQAREQVAAALSAARAVPADAPGDVGARRMRLLQAGTTLTEDLDAVLDVAPSEVAWVERVGTQPVLRVAPVDVAELLAEGLFGQVTTVLTSATLPPGTAGRLGLTAATATVLDVGSPFDFATQALLYCAAHLPDPRSPGFDDAAHDELAALVEAAGGRTLALFTSRRAMLAAAEELRTRLDTPVLTQDDLPRQALIDTFSSDEATSLFATMGFWQGVDIPGPSLSLVAIDRLPFPRPDEPLLQARRERARADAFRVVDLPRATTLLAQGVGRLIRSRTDRGVVAVLDRRLATARYRWEIVRVLPPMRRTRHREDAVAFLRALRADPDAALPPVSSRGAAAPGRAGPSPGRP